MLGHYLYFKDVRFKFEIHVCNKCDDVLMTAYKLIDTAKLNVNVLSWFQVYVMGYQ